MSSTDNLDQTHQAYHTSTWNYMIVWLMGILTGLTIGLMVHYELSRLARVRAAMQVEQKYQ